MRTKKEIASDTLKIIDQGFYKFGADQINIFEDLEFSLSKTFTISPENWNDIKDNQKNINHDTKIVILNCSTIESFTKYKCEGKTALLNFASAKNPGGGFIGGASAQEESLARSSNLYATLKKNEKMYQFNKSQKTFLYSNYMIYSPNVVFWFDDQGNPFSKPYKVDIITSPAPNKGAMIQHERFEELENLESEFQNRMEKVLQIASNQEVENLILGAWGCGVFRNDPKFVSESFKMIISEKFPKNFKKIIFAILDSSKEKKVIRNFKDAFEI